MKKIARNLFVIIFLFSARLSASENTAASERHFLWKAKSPTATVYLLGSIHAAQKELYPLPQPLIEAFHASKIVVVEADLSRSDSDQIQKEMMEAAVSDQNLEERLPPDLYKKLKSEFESSGVPIQAFSNLDPWFAALQLTMLKIQVLGFDPGLGIDQYFIQRASQSGREIQELESALAQIQILNSFTPEEETYFVKYSLEGLNGLAPTLERLEEAWKGGDAKSLAEEVIEKPLREEPALRPIFDKLFFIRNREMTQKIMNYLQASDTYLVIVGAGHLVGKEGILDLLEQKNVSIEQL